MQWYRRPDSRLQGWGFFGVFGMIVGLGHKSMVVCGFFVYRFPLLYAVYAFMESGT